MAEIVSFIEGLMRRRRLLPSQLARELKISHATVRRWLLGEDVPNTSSCRRLAEYSGMSLQEVLAAAGHLSQVREDRAFAWPEFREYARQKYPGELDEDIISMIEDLIERRREQGDGQQRRRSRRAKR